MIAAVYLALALALSLLAIGQFVRWAAQDEGVYFWAAIVSAAAAAINLYVGLS